MDTKLTGLTAITAPVSTDVTYVVSDPGGTPVSKKTTLADLGKGLGVVGKVTVTQPATSATLTIADGKTLTASNTLTFTGTDASSVAFGTGGTVLYSGGALGTPASGTVTNLTGTASINIDGTVGATTPAVGNFTNLTTTGDSLFGYTLAYGVTGLTSPKLRVTGTTISTASTQQGLFNSGGEGPRHTFISSRGITAGTNAILQSADLLGETRYAGDDGVGYIRAASIAAYVDGTPGANDMPGRLVFGTTQDGASSPTEAVRIDSSQRVGINRIPASGYKLDIGGTGDATIRMMASGQANGLELGQMTADGGSKIFVANNNYLSIGTNNTERMRITSLGQLTLSPVSGVTAGILLTAPANAAAPTNGWVYLSLNNTQTNALTAQKIDLGTSAQGHTGLLVNAFNASTAVHAIEAQLGSTGSGIALYLQGTNPTYAGTVVDSSLTRQGTGATASTTTDTYKFFTYDDRRNAATFTNNFASFHIKRTSQSAGASTTFNAQGSVLKLENVATQAAGTLTDTVTPLLVVQDADSTGVPIAITQNAVVSTNFKKLISETGGGVTIWVSNGNTPNGALSGTAGDICLNGTSGQTFYCSGTTTWVGM